MLANYTENGDSDFIYVDGFMHSGVSVSSLSDNFLILHVTCDDIKQKVALLTFFPPKLTIMQPSFLFHLSESLFGAVSESFAFVDVNTLTFGFSF